MNTKERQLAIAHLQMSRQRLDKALEYLDPGDTVSARLKEARATLKVAERLLEARK